MKSFISLETNKIFVSIFHYRVGNLNLSFVTSGDFIEAKNNVEKYIHDNFYTTKFTFVSAYSSDNCHNLININKQNEGTTK